MLRKVFRVSAAVAFFCFAGSASAQDPSDVLGSWKVTHTLSGAEWGSRRGITWSENLEFERSGSEASATFPSDQTEIRTDGTAAWLTCRCVCPADRKTQQVQLVWSADKRRFSYTYTTHSNECGGSARRITSAFSR